MTIELFTELISSIGLPIACMIALAIGIYKLWQRSCERDDKLLAELEKARATNDKCIEVLSLYAERLGDIETSVSTIKSDLIEIKTKI